MPCPSPDEELQQAGGQAALRSGAAAHHWTQLLRVAAQQRLALRPQQGDGDERLGGQRLQQGRRGLGFRGGHQVLVVPAVDGTEHYPGRTGISCVGTPESPIHHADDTGSRRQVRLR